MARNVKIEEMASAIMESMEEYADLATEDLKKAVKSAGEAVRDEIREKAPKRTGAYRKKLGGEKYEGNGQRLRGDGLFP